MAEDFLTLPWLGSLDTNKAVMPAFLSRAFAYSLWQKPPMQRGLTFGKYVGVQLVNYGIDLGLFLLFLDILGWPIWLAAFLSRTLSGIFTFISHKFFTFGARGTSLKREAILYFSLLFGYAPVAAALVTYISQYLSPVPAKLVADVISVVITYNLTRRLVFPAAKDKPA